MENNNLNKTFYKDVFAYISVYVLSYLLNTNVVIKQLRCSIYGLFLFYTKFLCLSGQTYVCFNDSNMELPS